MHDKVKITLSIPVKSFIRTWRREPKSQKYETKKVKAIHMDCVGIEPTTFHTLIQ